MATLGILYLLCMWWLVEMVARAPDEPFPGAWG